MSYARKTEYSFENQNISCADEVWRAMAEFANQCLNGISHVAGKVLQATHKCANYTWKGIAWVGNRALLPVIYTGINVTGYGVDKILFGSPIIRPYFHDGLLPSDISSAWRDWVKNNTGWDIYETMGAIPSNILGLAGLGVGYLNILNHLVTSIYFNINEYSHVLGRYGVFGENKKENDPRNVVVKVFSGLLSLPVVIPIVALTNICDAAFTIIKHTALSFWHNLSVSYNLLGEHGIFGPRNKYADDRGLPNKIIFGMVTAPFVFATAAITNTIDLIGGYFKNWRQTIKKPALYTLGFAASVFLSIPTFILRKTFKGVYNLTVKPIQDKLADKPFNGWRMLRGALNVVTLGLASGVVQVFKGITGYTHRFGYPNKFSASAGENDTLLLNHFNETQGKFSEAINLAIKGHLPGIIDDQKIIRPMMRCFFGMRNKAEEILKTLHDAYQNYAQRLDNSNEQKTNIAFNMNSFFQSRDFRQAEGNIRNNSRPGEEHMLERIENYLLPRMS